MSTIIYLYLKTHNKTGLKYLGKTTQDPFKYRGSGLHWGRHIKKHGYDVTTEILFESFDKEEIKEKGIYYSELFDVVASKEFANMRPESGDGGDVSQFVDYSKHPYPSQLFTEQAKKNQVESRRNGKGFQQVKGRKRSKEEIEKTKNTTIERFGGYDFNKDSEKIKRGVETRKRNESYEKTDDVKERTSKGMKEVWELRRQGLLPMPDHNKNLEHVRETARRTTKEVWELRKQGLLPMPKQKNKRTDY
jgi:hypothetical protein